MKKNITSLLISALIGAIVSILYTALCNWLGYKDCLSSSIIYAIIGASITYSLIQPKIRSRIHHIFCELDWAEECVKSYNSIPSLYRKSFWQLFLFLNLAFLFHTIHFMWGNKDWAAIRYAVDTEEALQEGRFTAFWLQELLFDGKILPVINNLWTFAGLSLAGVLLGAYWKLPQKTGAYVVTGLFILITPYTMSWLYFAQNMLGNLWLPAIVISALLLSEIRNKDINTTYICNLISVLLFVIALGTYFPVINFIGVAILGKVFLQTVFSDITLKCAFKRVLQSITNFTSGLMIYIFIIVILKDNDIMQESYKTVLAPIWSYPSRLPEFLISLFTQFSVTMPFMDIIYKGGYIIMVLIGLFSVILLSPNAQASLRGLCLIPLILLFSKLSFLLCMPNPEDLPHIARIDFYGLPLIYGLALTIILKLGGEYLKRIGYGLAILIIFMGFVRVSYAQKVWKFGWEAETKLAERIITRLEKMEDFNINRTYQIIQIGEKSLRKKYYLQKATESNSNELLDWAYYASGNSKDAYNFYYQTDFLYQEGNLEQAIKSRPEIKDYLLNQARAWPAQESILIIGDYIILILDERALLKVQKAISTPHTN